DWWIAETRTAAGEWVHCGACLDVAPSLTGLRLHMRVLPGRPAWLLLASFSKLNLRRSLEGVFAPASAPRSLDTVATRGVGNIVQLSWPSGLSCSRRGWRFFQES